MIKLDSFKKINLDSFIYNDQAGLLYLELSSWTLVFRMIKLVCCIKNDQAELLYLE